MFDQSFTAKNLIKIYNAENKKGVNVAGLFFPELLSKYDKIKRARKLIAKLYFNRRIYRKETFESRISKLYKLRVIYRKAKNEAIESSLEVVAKKINSKKFSFEISKLSFKKNEKDVFVTRSNAETFFAEKQIQRNIKNTYSVMQSDKDLIVPQVRSILSDKFPKYIIKADINSFYESIDRSLLVKKLNENPILSLSTRKLISKLMKDYEVLTGEDKGIPRGIGISAYLAELYLKEFDKKIRKIENLIYYSRYVDDIIVIISPNSSGSLKDYLRKIDLMIKEELLELNTVKTKEFDYKGVATQYSFDYLGYKFKKIGSVLKLSVSDKKMKKYKKKIIMTIDKYIRQSINQPAKSKKEFFMRLKFLTTNTKLFNNKGNASTGIYNANKWATDIGFLSDLDKYLIGNSMKIENESVRNKVNKYSFLKGFNEKLYSQFTPKEFEIIVRLWKENVTL